MPAGAGVVPVVGLGVCCCWRFNYFRGGNEVKKAMMVVAVGFAAVTFAGCEGEAAEDTVTVDVGTAAILVQYPPTTIVGEGSCSLTSDG